ncbi:FAD-binding oxidoreductase [Spirillospora sp. NPDC047279]|uniref:FAD-binding oxidoreductase n=1 Tax=Spirillospora sp. NPDC047279 TaxID=3155478 RepID=UPI0033C59AF5
MERRTFLAATALGGLGSFTASGCSPDGDRGGAGPKATTPRASRPAPTGPADWNALERGLEGRLIRPGDAAYDQAKRLYIPRYDRVRPAGIAYCEIPQDVAECVAFATRRRLPVAVRSGGHNYAGWSTGSGLVVDVSAMDAVEHDGGRATVGAGTRLIDLYDRLSRAGAGVPAGTCPTVGIAGLALGGGLGVLSRAYGLTCDVLESVRVVTADGRVRTCDAAREPELYWACRGGGGGNFGVAVEFTFRTHEAGDLTTFDLRWPWSRAAAVLRGWQRWLPSASDGVWTSVQINTSPGAGAPTIDITGVAAESPERDLDRLTAAVGDEPDGPGLVRRSYLATMQRVGGCAGQSIDACHGQGTLPGRRPGGRFPRTDYAGKSHVVTRPLTDTGIEALLARFARGNEVSGRSVLIDALGGAIGRVKPGDTAFPHRGALFCAQYLADGDDRDWLRATHRAMEPHAGGAAYVNYIDPELAGWARAYYGPNLERLRRAKAAYDPARLFRFPQSVG